MVQEIHEGDRHRFRQPALTIGASSDQIRATVSFLNPET
jgi:hypothetical protein